MTSDKVSAIWSRLTEPDAAMQKPEQYHQTRLFIILMLFLLPLGVLSAFAPVLVYPEKILSKTPLLILILVIAAAMTIVYLLGYRRHTSFSALIALSVGLIAILVAARLDASPEDLHALYYLLILALAGSLFFPLKTGFMFAAVTLASMLFTPLFIPTVQLYDILIGPFNLTLLTATAVLITTLYRNQLENARQNQRAQLLTELAHRADQLTALHETSLDIISHRDINELLQAIITRAANLLGVAGGSVYLVNPDGQTMTLTAVYGPGKELEGMQIKPGQGISGQVLATGQPQMVLDYDQSPRRIESISKNLIGSVLQVPIVTSGKVIGVLSCQEAAGDFRAFTEADITLLERLAQQSAIALQNSYLFKEEQAARDRAERLQTATQALSSSLVLQDVFENILVELQKVVPYDSATVQQLKDPHRLEIIGGHGFSNLEELLRIQFDLTASDNPNRHVIESRSSVLLADAPAIYDGFHREPHSQTIIHSWLGVPLLFGNQITGMLALDKREVGFYTQEHARLASAFAAQAAVAIENARLYEETRRHASELETLAQISASLRTIKTVADMLPVLLQKTVEAVGATYSILYLTDQETGELVSRLSYPSDYYRAGLRQQPGAGITGYVAVTQEIHISEDVANDPLFSLLPGEEAYFRETHSAISVPLQTPERIVGVMHIGSVSGKIFTEADARLLTAVSNIAANALNRAALKESLEQRVEDRTQALAQANARLQDLDTLKTKFISDISHELRTPVATLNLYMDLLERGKPENKDKYMAVLRQKTDSLVRLTEDILNASRLRLYEDELKFTAVDLNKTVAVVIAMHRDRAQAANIQLIFTPAPHLPPIRAERNQILQAVNNVVSNALDYTPEGSVIVSTSLDADAHQACLQITDTGIGIAPDELPHIFERFYRGHDVAQSNIPGTGLGLTIVQEIVDLHKGSIEVESQPGEGSTFRIKWPLSDRFEPV